MSQLIKKLKATQPQNTFVTPDAAAKIISIVWTKIQKGLFCCLECKPINNDGLSWILFFWI